MDGKVNYHRFVLCKTPHEKTAIRREMTLFPKVSKTAVFRKIAKGGPREKFAAVFDTFGKSVISRLIAVFSCGFLHSTNL